MTIAIIPGTRPEIIKMRSHHMPEEINREVADLISDYLWSSLCTRA